MPEDGKNKRIHRMVVNEISLVKNPANEEEEYLIMKNMDEAEVKKAADAHKQLMVERLDALQKLSEDITKNAMTMEADALSHKLSQLNDISWGIRDMAYTVNIAKSGGITMTDQKTDTDPLAEVNKKLAEIGTLMNELSKAKGKDEGKGDGKDEDIEKQPKFKCPKCGYEGVPGKGGVCPKCGEKMEQVEKAGKEYGKYPDISPKLKKIKSLVDELGKLLEAVTGYKKSTDAEDVEKGVKQLSKERQRRLIESLKPVVELLQEVDPEFDLVSALNPPEPSEVEKAVSNSEQRVMDGVTKAIEEALNPIKEKVEELTGARGDSRAETTDDDTPTQKSKDRFWGGKILS